MRLGELLTAAYDLVNLAIAAQEAIEVYGIRDYDIGEFEALAGKLTREFMELDQWTIDPAPITRLHHALRALRLGLRHEPDEIENAITAAAELAERIALAAREDQRRGTGPPQPDRDLVTLSQMAVFLRMTKDALRKRMKRNRLPGPKIKASRRGSHHLYSWSELRPHLAREFPGRELPENFPGSF